MVSLVQSARLTISAIEMPALSAAGVAAPCVEWALNAQLSIPASNRQFLTQLERVAECTGLCGLLTERNNLFGSETDFGLKACVGISYSLRHEHGQSNLFLRETSTLN